MTVRIVVPLVAVAAVFFGISWLAEFRPAPVEEVYRCQQPDSLPDTLTLVSWNIGYAGLGDNMDFFYDGGRRVRDTDVYKRQGYAIFGVGIEIAGITVSKIIVKWFKGKELALAMGLEMACARIGTALALSITPLLAEEFGSVSMPILLGLLLLCIGMISFVVFVVMDTKRAVSYTHLAKNTY